MNIVFHDPPGGPHYHEYIDKIWFKGLQQYLHANGKPVQTDNVLGKIHNATVLTSADYLNAETIETLHNNGCKIVGFSVTDSSYVSQSCREASEMADIDLIFAATGIQKVNEGYEFVVDKDFNVSLDKRQFLPVDDWIVFNNMRKMGRLQSLPYVHWSKLPEQPVRPYAERIQKVIMRGGLHARRYILALFLMRHDLLDTNSGFVSSPYFSDSMRPEFRYCDECRRHYKATARQAIYFPGHSVEGCNSPAFRGDGRWSFEDLGHWNNRCPRSFYWMAERFEKVHGPLNYSDVEKTLNGQWLTSEAHQELLGRITFTSDLKWLFSIYAAQRFWDAAAAGCMNVLPGRTIDQEYFPEMSMGEHYTCYHEGMYRFGEWFITGDSHYNHITQNARALYDQWIVPGPHVLNTNLARHIIEQIERHCA